jgi:biopolymer transport protein TolR
MATDNASAKPQALSASQRARIRRLSAPRELAPDEEGGELNIIPFLDIVMNVLMFVLATISVTFTATIATSPPRAGGARAAANQAPSLSLTVIIVPDGFSIKGSGSNVSPGCQGAGPGLAIPKIGNEYDYAGLKKCAAALKTASDAYKDERQVTLSANPNIPYSVLVSAMDAVRTAPEKPGEDQAQDLFPEVNFGLAK